MARFRAPTVSSASIDSTTSNTRRVDAHGRISKVAKLTLRTESKASSSGQSSKRKRSTSDEQRKAIIREAQKLDKLRVTMKKREPCFLFIGNIPPTATDASLKALFKRCGTIESACIRCSSGAAIFSGGTCAYETPKDRRYATITFTRRSSVAKALKMNGLVVDGYKILVCISASQLPEVRDMVTWRIRAIQERKGAQKRSPLKSYRGLMPVPTEPLLDEDVQMTEAPAAGGNVLHQLQSKIPLVRNFMFWNMTFAKSVI